MDLVLMTSELLEIIFACPDIDRASRASSARVCKAWSSLALAPLWADQYGVKRLFSILSPMKLKEDRGRYIYVFQRDITGDDWKNFDRYAPFVKRLTLDDDSDQILPICKAVARTSSRDFLLPNLKYLSVGCDANNTTYSVMFLHSGLSQINIVGFRVDEEQRMCRNIIGHAPNITQLRLNLHYCIGHSEETLMQLFGSLASLRKVSLPKFFLTGRMMSALSKIPNLEEIEMAIYDPESHDELMEGRASDLKVFRPVLAEGIFSSLRRLDIAATLKDSTRLFSTSLNGLNMTSFYLNTPWPQSNDYFRELFKCLSGSCISLESLVVATDKWDGFTSDSELDKVTFDHLRPLLKLRNIRSFVFYYPRPVVLVDRDLAELGENWGKLKRLAFNTEPRIQDKPSLTITALGTLAASCPNLESLDIYLDASSMGALPYPSGKFLRMKSLFFGNSPIFGTLEVAIFISRLCAECEKRPYIFSNNVAWVDVVKMLTLAFQMLKNEKDRPMPQPRE